MGLLEGLLYDINWDRLFVGCKVRIDALAEKERVESACLYHCPAATAATDLRSQSYHNWSRITTSIMPNDIQFRALPLHLSQYTHTQ